jgi:plasmid stability protein
MTILQTIEKLDPRSKSLLEALAATGGKSVEQTAEDLLSRPAVLAEQIKIETHKLMFG